MYSLFLVSNATRHCTDPLVLSAFSEEEGGWAKEAEEPVYKRGKGRKQGREVCVGGGAWTGFFPLRALAVFFLVSHASIHTTKMQCLLIFSYPLLYTHTTNTHDQATKFHYTYAHDTYTRPLYSSSISVVYPRSVVYSTPGLEDGEA